MSESPVPIRVAQIVGITTSSAMAGTIGSISIFFIPRLLEAPTPLMLKQWKNLFEHGAAVMPPLAVIAASAYFYLAYHARQLSSGSAKWKLYLTAGLLTVGIVPYTIAIIRPTNDKLMEKYEETKTLSIKDEVVEAGLGEETAHKLVDNWGVLNLGRSVILISAGVLGAYTTLF